jgi:hypothetical protein
LGVVGAAQVALGRRRRRIGGFLGGATRILCLVLGHDELLYKRDR